jgi:transposase
MDNAPIHTADAIDALITETGHKCVYLPPYSPELNPIEQFWSIVENKVKHNQFQDKGDLATRIAEACNAVPRKHLKAFIQHPVNVFEKCLKGDPYLMNLLFN